MGEGPFARPFWSRSWPSRDALGLGLPETLWPLRTRGILDQHQWSQIRKDLEERIDYQKLEVLFSDGGPSIEVNLLRTGMDHQRCQWYEKRDFPYTLYADGLKKTEQLPLLEKINSIPAMHFTKSQLEQLFQEDRPLIEQIAQKTQQRISGLIGYPGSQEVSKGQSLYCERHEKPVTTFLAWWLHKGEIISLNTNAIGSAFSQVCTRIKKVGKRNGPKMFC